MLAKIATVLGIVSTANAALEGGVAGGIQMFAKPSSLNSITSFAANLIVNAAVVGKPIAINSHKVIAGFTIDTESILVEKYSCKSSGLDFTEEGYARLFLKGIDFSGQLNGTMSAPNNTLPATVKTFSVTNASLVIEFMTFNEGDSVQWSLDENTNFTVSDVELTFVEPFWNFFMTAAHKDFMQLIDFGAHLAEGALLGAVSALNEKVKQQVSDPEIFLGAVAGHVFNFTMTRFPEINQEKNSITVNFDGRGYNEVLKAPISFLNKEWAEVQSTQVEEVFIHQLVLDTLLAEFSKTFSEDAAAPFADIKSIKDTYGDNPVCSVTYASDKSYNRGLQFEMTVADGISLGGDSGVNATGLVYCAPNAETEKTYAFELAFNFNMTANGSFTDWIIFAELGNATVRDANCFHQSMCSLVSNWDQLVTDSIYIIVSDFNAKHATPVDLKDKYDIIGFVSGIIRNLTLTPNKVDNFLYAGFKWITDM